MKEPIDRMMFFISCLFVLGVIRPGGLHKKSNYTHNSNEILEYK